MKHLLTALLVLGTFMPMSYSAEEQSEDLDNPHFRWECIARDRGWEEHWNGHRAIGWNYQNAYYRAFNECRQFHRYCQIQCYRIH